MKDSITYLTDAVMITAVVPVGRADAMLKAARDVGVSGAIVHHARGTGARELLGLAAIAVEAEKEVVSIVVAAEHQDLVTRAICTAGDVGAPGGGYMYIAPIEKMATYIPQEALERMKSASKVTG